MGRNRLEHLVQDLDFSVTAFKANADRFMYPSRGRVIPSDSAMYSLGGGQEVLETSAWLDDAKFERLIKLDMGGYDLRTVSLKSFLLPPNDHPTWPEKATKQGRREMAAAVANLELFLSTFFHSCFEGTLHPLYKLLNRGINLKALDNYHDVYIWIKIQESLSEWSTDVRKATRAVPPIGYKYMPVKEPRDVARMLSAYVADMVRGADPKTSREDPRAWEFAPHLTFYSQEGAFLRYQFGDEQSRVGPGSSGGKDAEAVGKKQRTRSKVLRDRSPSTARSEDERTAAQSKKRLEREKKELCAFQVKNLMGIQKAGRLVTCHGGDHCTRRHPRSLREVTLADVLLISGGWTSEDKHTRDGVRTFKKE
jgi:hypothetical protein